MEPRVAERDGSAPPVIGWTAESPDSPSSEIYKTAKSSPVILRKGSVETFSGNTEVSPDSLKSNNNEVKNGDVIQYTDGVKFEDDSICSSGSSGSDDDDSPKKPKYPDGGWGWVVVFSSLVISMVADGISFSFGLLYVEFSDKFGQSNSKTAWIGSLFMAVPLLSGPIMSALVDRYGCKWMTILGGVVSAFGFVLSCFGNSVEYEYVTFGLIAGLGLGLCYVTAVVSIAYWFDKYRTLAVGLGACGTGIGTFVYAPMTQYFIDEYGWRGTILLLAGTLLNMCVCGAVMRDPEWWIEEQKERAEASVAGTKSVRNASSCGSISDIQFPGPEEIKSMIKAGNTPEFVLTTTVKQLKEAEAKEAKEEKSPVNFHSVVNLPTFVHQKETVPLEVLQKLRGNGRLFNVILENYPPLLSCKSLSDQGKINQAGTPETSERRVVPTMSLRVKKKKQSVVNIAPVIESAEDILEGTAEPLLGSYNEPLPVIVNGYNNKLPRRSLAGFRRQFSLKEPAQHYLKDIRLHRNSVMYRGAMLNIPRYRLRASSCPNIYRNSMTTLAKESEGRWDSLLETVKGIFDFSMFLEFHFLLMCLSTILLFTWFIVPYFYLVRYMVEWGFTEQEGSQVISTIGVSNTVGMIFFGWLGDQPWVSVPKAYAFCMLWCGLSCIVIPAVIYNWWLTTVFGCIFGFFFGGAYSFTPTIVVSLIPIERFTTAYGLILLSQGIGNMVGPPLAGLGRDLTGFWDTSFYMSGVWIVVSGLLVGFIPYTRNRRIWGSGRVVRELHRKLRQVKEAGDPRSFSWDLEEEWEFLWNSYCGSSDGKSNK